MTLEMYEDSDDGIRLPHPQLPLHVHLVIETAIRVAWELMVSKGREGFDFESAHEDDVTLELYERLYDEVFDKGIVAGFDRAIFATIQREPKVRNYNRLHPDKMPDILVNFIDRPVGVMNSQHGLFIECKPVDRKHPTGSAYCDEGIIRFIRGDYAWTMQSAMMVGYARKGYSLLPKLSEALTSNRKEPIPTSFGPENCRRTMATAFAEQVAISTHQRTFKYQENGLPAGNITIRHLWLKRGGVEK